MPPHNQAPEKWKTCCQFTSDRFVAGWNAYTSSERIKPMSSYMPEIIHVTPPSGTCHMPVKWRRADTQANFDDPHVVLYEHCQRKHPHAIFRPQLQDDQGTVIVQIGVESTGMNMIHYSGCTLAGQEIFSEKLPHALPGSEIRLLALKSARDNMPGVRKGRTRIVTIGPDGSILTGSSGPLEPPSSSADPSARHAQGPPQLACEGNEPDQNVAGRRRLRRRVAPVTGAVAGNGRS